MSTPFYDLASLVVVPSGYKSGKIYAQKPLTTDGQLTFTRASNATRVASNGLIEKVRTNVVLRSEEQSNGQYGAVINQIASRVAVANPLTGQNNAYKITSAGGTDPYLGQTVNGLSNGENTFSLWLWTDSGQNTAADLIFYNAAATEVYSTSLTITTTPTRYSFTVNFASVGASATVRLDLCQSCGVTYLYTYGWQAESGAMTAYIPTVTAAVSVGPVSGLPRLDYLNSTCPRLLLEPQRTNVALQSQDFTTTWTTYTSSVSSNTAVAPDGTTTADSLIDNTSDDQHLVQQLVTTSAGTYTISVFAKANTLSHAWIKYFNGTSAQESGIYNLANGTVSGAGLITSYGNGWYRLTLQVTAITGNGYVYLITSNGTSKFYAGTGKSIFVWGYQLEAGAYATSYIPTLGTSVTRVADACYKTGISSLIGQTEGTMFIDADYIVSDGSNFNTLMILTPSAGVGAGYVVIDRYPNNTVVCEYNQGGSQAKITSVATYGSQRLKIAFAYKANDFVAYVNGVQIGTDNSGTTGLTLTDLSMPYTPNDPFGGRISQALLFKTRLTNAQLAELTTL
jgi:hypothetical protein